MRTVRQVLESKNPEVQAVGPDAPVIEALRLMAEHGIGSVLVLDGENRLVGIVSERDYARKVVLTGRTSQQTRVRDIMVDTVTTIGPDDTVAHCMQLMTDGRFRHLPVLEDGRIVGIVSIGDLVKAVIEDQQVELDQLQRYIAS
ncbi:CBS domain-containing protein [Luteimonas sp. MHLX1A]|uniref:CBS domain-containing protein n=1 Tax=Alterluteimonas muca TaxID=2878684 RepID=UPI001E515AD9|nr:CBS domain-containing protein [Luteimonas sp. MHLX1A]MCD9047690.1 CBS domain-containing protein [Luteimonas sp. MHLX1A]